MHHIGNDIVAYKHKRCIGKWRDARFLQKILTEKEITQLQLQTNKDAYLWMLWTLKEAAYKLSCFLGNRNKFHAIQFEIEYTSLLTDELVLQSLHYPIVIDMSLPYLLSEVKYDGQSFFGKTLITNECVHSTVSDSASADFLCAITVHSNYNKNDFSTEVRNFAKEFLLKSKIEFSQIEKDKDGIPFVTLNNKQQYISLSHDQQFVSFAFPIIEVR